LPTRHLRSSKADICDEPALRAVFEQHKPDVVVHLAARAGVRPSLQDPNLYHRVNVIGGQHILDACRDYKPSHLVFASSSSVYGGSKDVPFKETDPVMRPVSPYAATKRMNELQAHVYSHIYGVHVSMLRFFTVYGPRQRPDMAIHKFTKAILAGKAATVLRRWRRPARLHLHRRHHRRRGALLWIGLSATRSSISARATPPASRARRAHREAHRQAGRARSPADAARRC
jgi:nucleoside-diphosphate-sugar epimerase